MREAVFEKARKPFKQAFKTHQDKLFETLQSKPFLIEGRSYVLVGEHRIKGFPLLSHFDVLDENYQSAKEGIGRRVHGLVSQVLLIDELSGIQIPLKEQIDTGSSEVSGVVDAETALSKLEELRAHVDKIRSNEFIEDEAVDKLASLWDFFWALYQPRVHALMNAYEAKQLGGNKSLLEEAKRAHKIYQQLLSTESFPPIDSIVDGNYRVGRLRQHDPPLETPNKSERQRYSIFMFTFRFLIVVVAFIIYAVILDGESIFEALIPVLISLGIAVIVQKQIKSRLLSKSSLYYRSHRLESK